MFLTTRVYALVAMGALAMASACLLAACDGPSPGQPQPASGAKPAPPPKVARVADNMVAAVSAGNAATAIGVHFALGKVPAVGVELPMEIAFVPHRKFATIQAHFESRDGLKVTVGRSFGPRTDVEAETSIQHQVVLLPAREGVFMLTVGVNTVSEEGDQTRVFSIPVIVGPTQAASAPAEQPKSAPADPATN
jgi:hypothetical protein